jgi:hypothetical protein
MNNSVIDQYKLEAEIQDENATLPVRCIATNSDDKSTAEAWLSMQRTRDLFSFMYGEHAASQLELLREQHYHQFIASLTSPCVVNSRELVPFGFLPEELRPWRLEPQGGE